MTQLAGTREEHDFHVEHGVSGVALRDRSSNGGAFSVFARFNQRVVSKKAVRTRRVCATSTSSAQINLTAL